MIIGLLKDIKKGEYRTIMTPTEVQSITADGHLVLVQSTAGEGAGFSDDSYQGSGAKIIQSAKEVWKKADLITKVKELDPSEYDLLREDQIIFTCLHPAAHKDEVDVLLKKKAICFTAEDSHRYGSPNCEAAGKQGALAGLDSMLAINGGKGKFVSGLSGSPAMEVLVLGYGAVGRGAIDVLFGLGAKLTVMGNNIGNLRNLKYQYNNNINTCLSTKENIKKLLPRIDMVLNCVKWPKGRNDFLIDRDMLLLMEKGSVIVDISNDDNGAIESFRETTHEDPRYIESGIVHYCVSNIPSAISQSTSISYASAVFPHLRNLLNDGVAEACVKDGFLRRSMTAYKGYLTHEETSAIQNRPWIQPEVILGISDRKLDYAPPATVTKSDIVIDIKDVVL